MSQRITDDRVASGWLGEDVMMGGEDGGHYRAEGQFHPATVHWRTAAGDVAWLRVRSTNPLDAMVFEPGVLEVEGTDLAIDQSAPFPGDIDETDDVIVIRYPVSTTT